MHKYCDKSTTVQNVTKVLVDCVASRVFTLAVAVTSDPEISSWRNIMKMNNLVYHRVIITHRHMKP